MGKILEAKKSLEERYDFAEYEADLNQLREEFFFYNQDQISLFGKEAIKAWAYIAKEFDKNFIEEYDESRGSSTGNTSGLNLEDGKREKAFMQIEPFNSLNTAGLEIFKN